MTGTKVSTSVRNVVPAVVQALLTVVCDGGGHKGSQSGYSESGDLDHCERLAKSDQRKGRSVGGWDDEWRKPLLPA